MAVADRGKGFYVATDPLCKEGGSYEWSIRAAKGDFAFTFERYYWSEKGRTWYGDILKATRYDAAEDAEAAAFTAVLLDANLFSHVHVVNERTAMRREKTNIAARDYVKSTNAAIRKKRRMSKP